jgi:HEPN domain-containing protein
MNDFSFTSRDSFQRLSQDKIEDAIILLEHKRFSNAYYLAGYAIETALKAALCKVFLAECLPDRKLVQSVYTHDLQALMKLTGLSKALEQSMKLDPNLASNWSTVLQWSEASRYEILETLKAVDMVKAVADPKHGVLQWLKHHW